MRLINEFKWQTERMSKTIILVCKPCFFHYKARYKYLYVFKWVNKIKQNIYIFIAIALDESICLDVLHFPMKNIKSRDLEATPMGGPTSKPIQ